MPVVPGNLPVLIVFGGLALGGAVREIARRRRARRRVRQGGGELEDNALVTLVGVAYPLAPLLVAPVTGRPCIAHCTSARVYDPQARQHGRPLVSVHAKSQAVKFELRCPPGPIIVEATRVEVDLRLRELRRRNVRGEQEFLEGSGLPYALDSVTCYQAVVTAGQRVTVHGVVRVEATPTSGVETGFREVARTMRIVGDERHPLVITDA